MAQSESAKKIWLWCAVIACSLAAIYLGLFAFVSLWIGFTHMDQSGFWVPLLAGTVSLITIFVVFLCIARRIVSQIRDEDLLSM